MELVRLITIMMVTKIYMLQIMETVNFSKIKETPNSMTYQMNQKFLYLTDMTIEQLVALGGIITKMVS